MNAARENGVEVKQKIKANVNWLSVQERTCRRSHSAGTYSFACRRTYTYKNHKILMRATHHRRRQLARAALDSCAQFIFHVDFFYQSAIRVNGWFRTAVYLYTRLLSLSIFFLAIFFFFFLFRFSFYQSIWEFFFILFCRPSFVYLCLHMLDYARQYLTIII